MQAKVWGNSALLAKIWFLESPRSQRAHQQYADYLLRTGDADGAREVFVQDKKNGVAPLNSALQITLLDCARNRATPENEVKDVLYRLQTEPLNIIPYVHLIRLHQEVDAGRCGGSISQDDWLALSKAAVENSTGKPNHASLRFERAVHFIHQRNLEDTMIELEAAYAADPDPRIAILAASLLVDAHLDTLALEWLNLIGKHDVNPLKTWLRNDHDAEVKLRNIIKQREQAASRSQRGNKS